MKLKHLMPAFILAGSLIAAEEPDKPLLTAELDSIECHFAPQEQQPPCTIRIHLQPQKGISITPVKAGDIPHEPLQCVDGKGHLLLGTFREWEHCYDGNDACHTAVYDFFTTPQGSSITIDSHISVPITREQDKAPIVPFSPKEHKQLNVAGHTLTIEPIAATPETKHAAQVAFAIIYDHPDTKKLLRLCDPNGKTVQYQARIKATSLAQNGQSQTTRVVYFLYSDKKTPQPALTTVPPTTIERVPIRFRASIGALDALPTPQDAK